MSPARVPSTYKPAVSDEAVKAKTGRTWSGWFHLLDQWGAPGKGHKATAKFLADEQGVPPWWSQMVTVEYERARGLRAVGQKGTGDYEATAQRTIAASPTRVKKAWTDPEARAAWLTDAKLKRDVEAALPTARSSKTSMGPVLRMDLPGKPGGKLDLTFEPKDGGKTALRVQHHKLPTSKDRDDLKPRWKKALDALKAHVEP